MVDENAQQDNKLRNHSVTVIKMLIKNPTRQHAISDLWGEANITEAKE